MFLYIGGEGELSPWELHSGHMAELSKKFHALMFALEHRFYGASHPTPTLEGQYMKYLNSNQALADIADFRYLEFGDMIICIAVRSKELGGRPRFRSFCRFQSPPPLPLIPPLPTTFPTPPPPPPPPPSTTKRR